MREAALATLDTCALRHLSPSLSPTQLARYPRIRTHARMHARMHASTHARARAHTYTHTWLASLINMHPCADEHAHTHTNTHTRTRARAHTHTMHACMHLINAHYQGLLPTTIHTHANNTYIHTREQEQDLLPRYIYIHTTALHIDTNEPQF